MTDYTPRETCPSRTRLVTGSMPEGAAETLAGLSGLEELRLYSTDGLDLSLFQALQRLREVDFSGSAVSHLEALTTLSSLQYVNLTETGTRDLAFAASIPALTELDLRDNHLTDLTPLLDCPWLTRLVLSSRHQMCIRDSLQTGQEMDDLPGYSSTRHIRTLTTADTMPDARIVSRILPWKRAEASSQFRRN